VAVVQAGKAAGIPLERVRDALESLPDQKQPTKRDWARFSSEWRTELDERIATLEAIRDRLTTCIGCGCLSLQTCRLLNPDDEAASIGAGAHYLRRVSPRGRGLAQRAR
jgi:redox-sensitive transcriptional activator SoxR